MQIHIRLDRKMTLPGIRNFYISVEALNVYQDIVVKNEITFRSFKIAMVICNVLQTVNMSLNFILYCTINTQFRRTLRNIFQKCEHGNKDGKGMETGNGISTATKLSHMESLMPSTSKI